MIRKLGDANSSPAILWWWRTGRAEGADGADEGEVRLLCTVALAGEDQVEVLLGCDGRHVGRAGAHLLFTAAAPGGTLSETGWLAGWPP